MSYNQIVSTGIIVADTSDIQAEVNAEWKASFGADFNVNEGPQAVMIEAEIATRASVEQNNAAVANQINPNNAGGVFLDAICALLGLERVAAQASRVPGVTIGGIPNTIIPAGSRAKTAAGDIFASAGNVSLGPSGTTTVDFIAVDTGAVPCNVGALTSVVDAIYGWETVSNTQAAILGNDQQSDASLRDLRDNTLASQGVSTVEAQVSDLYKVAGVRSLQFRENVAGTTQTIDGISLVAHSVWACVDGGTDLDVATSLLQNKTVGAAWNGATNVNVVEPNSGQTYAVAFDRPTNIPMLARVTVRKGSYAGDININVPQAVVDYATGNIQGFSGFRVGTQVSPFEIAGAVVAECAGLFVSKVEVAPVSTGVYQSVEYAIATNQLASIQASAVAVVIL